MAASRCFQRVLELEADNSQVQQEVSWPQLDDLASSTRLSTIINSDTERFKKRWSGVTGSSQWADQKERWGSTQRKLCCLLCSDSISVKPTQKWGQWQQWRIKITPCYSFLYWIPQILFSAEECRIPPGVWEDGRDWVWKARFQDGKPFHCYNRAHFCHVCRASTVAVISSNKLQVCVVLVCSGGLLHGPRLGGSLSLSQVQDTEGRVLSPAGTLPRGSVCSQVRESVCEIPQWTQAVNRTYAISGTLPRSNYGTCEWSAYISERKQEQTGNKYPYIYCLRISACFSVIFLLVFLKVWIEF